MKIACKITVVLILSVVSTGNPAQAEFITLENMPTGNYYYEGLRFSEVARSPYILLRKVGHAVAGVEIRGRVGNPCFKGFLDQNSVVDATRVLPPYNPASKWEHQKGEMFNLDSYRRIDRTFTASDNAALQKCLRVFSE